MHFASQERSFFRNEIPCLNMMGTTCVSRFIIFLGVMVSFSAWRYFFIYEVWDYGN